MNKQINTIMKTKNNIKDLNISIDELYEAKKQIEISISDKPYTFNLVLVDRKGFDCKISSFGANLYARTKKGLEYKKYKTVATLQREVVKLIKQKVDADGDITFSLSDEVYTF